MSDSSQTLVARLREESTRVNDFFKNLTNDQWDIKVYLPDSEWTLHHLLAHFASSEVGRKTLVQNILSGGEGVSSDFDIDIFNQQEVEKLLNKSNSYLLDLFLQARQELSNIVSDLEINDLNRIGTDPYLGKAPLRAIIKLTYRHLEIHLRDARRRL